MEDNFRSNSHNANKAREVREIETEKGRMGEREKGRDETALPLSNINAEKCFLYCVSCFICY